MQHQPPPAYVDVARSRPTAVQPDSHNPQPRKPPHTGLRPISSRNRTDLGAEFDRSRRGQVSALALPIGAIRVWPHPALWGRLVGPIRHMEMSHSGLVRLPAKKVGDKTPREFESPHLRSPPHSRAHRVAPAAFGLCPRRLLLPPRSLSSPLSPPDTCESGHFRGSRRDGTVCPTAPLSSP